jgi:hypothetical protein
MPSSTNGIKTDTAFTATSTLEAPSSPTSPPSSPASRYATQIAARKLSLPPVTDSYTMGLEQVSTSLACFEDKDKVPDLRRCGTCKELCQASRPISLGSYNSVHPDSKKRHLEQGTTTSHGGGLVAFPNPEDFDKRQAVK